MNWPAEDEDCQFDEFVESERVKLKQQPKPARMQPAGYLLAGVEQPPFDDPAYIERCEQTWRSDYIAEMKRLKKRWQGIITSALAGEYGSFVKSKWTESYPGANHESMAIIPMMQAAQCVWALKGSRCEERLPKFRTRAGDWYDESGYRKFREEYDNAKERKGAELAGG